jgi:hypothetical protein
MKIEFDNKPTSVVVFETWKAKLKIEIEDEIYDYDFNIVTDNGTPLIVWGSDYPFNFQEIEQFIIDKFLER